MAETYQNGRRVPSHAGGHPKDPRLKHLNSAKSDSHVDICRDFVRGTCDKYPWCKFRHEWDIKEIINKGILKFCHDYQNNRGQCTKSDCTYLHATSDEEELFKSSGVIPQALAEKHAFMVPPGMYNCNVSFGPPPPPPVNTAATLPSTTNMLITSTYNNAEMMIPYNLDPPPPPPPPLLPAPSSPPFAAKQTPTPVMVPTNITPVLPTKIDTSRPPPPLPVNGKHKLPDTEAGPSKLRKPDHSRTSCGHCVQRQIRIVLYKQEMEKLQAEDEKRSLEYKKKLQVLEKGKLMVRSRVSYDLYQFIEEYVEGIPDIFMKNDFVSESNQTSLTTSSVSRQLTILKLLKMLARNISESSLTSRFEESLLPALRTPVLESTSTQSVDLLQEIADVLNQCEHRPTNVSSGLSVPNTGSDGVFNPGVRPPTLPPALPPTLPPPLPQQRDYFASYPPALGPGADTTRPPPSFHPTPPVRFTPPAATHHYFPYQQ